MSDFFLEGFQVNDPFDMPWDEYYDNYLPDRMVLDSGRQCPTDQWYLPNFIEDYGDVKPTGTDGPVGYYYWNGGSLWCLYDQDGDLIGPFHPDANGAYSLSFSGTDGDASVGVSIGGTGVNGSTGNSTGGTFSVTLSPDGGG